VWEGGGVGVLGGIERWGWVGVEGGRASVEYVTEGGLGGGRGDGEGSGGGEVGDRGGGGG